ncbi:cytoskeletal protein CcmA (bactofilin family) [Citrobacter farmeri]|uniref:bactofilin family protein n=1 Tax=Citrobacter farmeri TaxID=67824 RepID=UPI00209E5D40|nr:polymer-forming cytoskeletal protein [Citrobacter farmeri]MCP1694838.1 cytoskeletal protein CcmA (bactofilin family) [Citrobacter farmeri]MCW2424962.1 cytoskeletal protein CcmA (bactofilin family) [Citrobacter farmeri]
MKLKLHAINFALFCWVAALIGKLIHCIYLTRIAVCLTVIGLIIHILINKDNNMFTFKSIKKYKKAPHEKTPITIIANNVCIEGDINSNEEIVQIFGKLKGNVVVNNGKVQIFKNGSVDGEITCNSLIINGRFNGKCVCESLEIEENGEITGTITYLYLTIKKGGLFSGYANSPNEKEHSTINTTPATIEDKEKNND